MNAASGIMLPNGQPAGGGGVPVTLIHDPGVSEAITGGLARLHDVHLFTEAARRFRDDENDQAYGGEFGQATREVLDDLNAFHTEVAAWGSEKQAALHAAAIAEQEAAERAAALDAAGDPETDDDAQADADAALEATA